MVMLLCYMTARVFQRRASGMPLVQPHGANVAAVGAGREAAGCSAGPGSAPGWAGRKLDAFRNLGTNAVLDASGGNLLIAATPAGGHPPRGNEMTADVDVTTLSSMLLSRLG